MLCFSFCISNNYDKKVRKNSGLFCYEILIGRSGIALHKKCDIGEEAHDQDEHKTTCDERQNSLEYSCNRQLADIREDEAAQTDGRSDLAQLHHGNDEHAEPDGVKELKIDYNREADEMNQKDILKIKSAGLGGCCGV